jgi:hypothetical protein
VAAVETQEVAKLLFRTNLLRDSVFALRHLKV